MSEENVFFNEQRMYRLFRNEQGALGLGVLCGGVGSYEKKMLLNDEEQREYESAGRTYLDRLAESVARNPRYDERVYT